MRAVLAAAVLVGVVSVAACGRGSSGTVPVAVDATADRDVTPDGTARLSSTITVHFDTEVHPVTGKVPLASNFELSVPAAKGGNDRVFVKSATAGGKIVTLSVDLIVPQGTTLKISRAAFSETAKGDVSVEVATPFTAFAATMATKAMTPTDPVIVPDVPATAAVKPEDRDPAAQRRALQTLLQQHGASADVVNAALVKYDQMPASIAPSPKIRAALAALTGTFAEPAINSLLTGENCTGRPASLIAFQLPEDSPGFLARVTYAIGGQRILSINPDLEGERLELLMPLLAHEAIHCDKQDSKAEEAAAVAFETFLYMQLLSADPSIARGGTLAVREENVDTIAFINSGRRYPESVGILQSAGVPRVLPGSDATYGSFGELVAAHYADVDSGTSPDEATAVSYVASLAKVANVLAQSPFNIRYLDDLLGQAMDPKTMQQAMAALTLVPAG